MENDAAVVVFENVNYSYNDVVVLEDINVKINEKDFLGVVGPNGCGKTTFLKIIIGLLHPQSGTVRVLDTTPVLARKEIGYVSQYLESDLSFPLSVIDVVLMGRLGNTNFLGKYKRSDKDAAMHSLEKVEMLDQKNRQFGRLSGGQRKRVLIARALVSDPKLLIMDEPSAHVDIKIRKQFYELLKKLNEEITIILSSHDLSFVSTYVNHVACLNRTMACHPTKEISGKMIEDLYRGPIRMVEHEIYCHPKDHDN